MSNALTTIRDGWALGELERCKAADGFQISLVHDGGAAVTLWTRSEIASISRVDENGVTNEYETRQFRIPLQTNFTGGLSENDEITVSTTGLDLSSRVYVVREWDTEHHGGVYVVAADRKTTRRSNV